MKYTALALCGLLAGCDDLQQQSIMTYTIFNEKGHWDTGVAVEAFAMRDPQMVVLQETDVFGPTMRPPEVSPTPERGCVVMSYRNFHCNKWGVRDGDAYFDHAKELDQHIRFVSGVEYYAVKYKLYMQ